MVIFSEASVSHSVHGEVLFFAGGAVLRVGAILRGDAMKRGGFCERGFCEWGLVKEPLPRSVSKQTIRILLECMLIYLFIGRDNKKLIIRFVFSTA